MPTTDGLPTDGASAAPSAFDRLFHRLVVAGDRPVVRKKKKKTGKKPPPAAPLTPAEPPAQTEVSSSSSSVYVAGSVPPPVDARAVACVRRLRLYRSLRRRLGGLPRDSAIQALAETGGLQALGTAQARSRQNERRHRRMVSLLSPTDRARSFMRVEAIAARLFNQHDNAFRTESTGSTGGSSSEWRVLHDFQFPLVQVAFQSLIQYESGPAMPKPDANAVPAAPQINW